MSEPWNISLSDGDDDEWYQIQLIPLLRAHTHAHTYGKRNRKLMKQSSNGFNAEAYIGYVLLYID